MNKHTPTPWKEDDFHCIVEADGKEIFWYTTDDDGIHCKPEDRAFIVRVVNNFDSLLLALQALGSKPDGYCFCINADQVAAGHTGECQDAQKAICKAEGK
jgi:hypothetical protein